MNEDPTGCQYITKEISLENAATSIKILLGGHVHADADIRCFYAIGDRTGFQPIFTPFPGFENINNKGQVINSANNNGQSDLFVPKTNQYGFGILKSFKNRILLTFGINGYLNDNKDIIIPYISLRYNIWKKLGY